MATESKRDKKRREILERVEAQHRDRLARRDEIIADQLNSLTEANHRLARDPSLYTALEIPLYLLNLERDALLESIGVHYENRLASIQRLHDLERTKIEDDYRKGRELVRQRLLDGIDERRRRIREDKESTSDIVAESLVEAAQVRAMATRPTRHSRPKARGDNAQTAPGGAAAASSSSSSSSSSTIAAAAALPSTPTGNDRAALAAQVATADALLATMLPTSLLGPNHLSGSSSSAASLMMMASAAAAPGGAPVTGGILTDSILSPMPYSLAVLPPPPTTISHGADGKSGKTARRAAASTASRARGDGANMVYYGAGASAADGNGWMDDGGSASGAAGGNPADAASSAQGDISAYWGGQGGTTVSTTTTSSGTTTVIRVPTMTGYAKVQGWTPGRSLEDLKGLVNCNEMEREADLARMRGWGRSRRAAAAATATAGGR